MDDLPARVGAAARAGVDLVQVREPNLDGGALARLVTACVSAVPDTGARVVVNDRLDVALATGAHGVHLPADGAPSARVRAAVPPGFLVGRSVHSAIEAKQAADGGAVDYLILGTVFTSVSKPGWRPCGTTALAAAAAGVSVPVLAIGGITLERVPEVVAAGAGGVAGISLFATGTPTNLERTVAAIRRMFDTPEGLS